MSRFSTITTASRNRVRSIKFTYNLTFLFRSSSRNDDLRRSHRWRSRRLSRSVLVIRLKDYRISGDSGGPLICEINGNAVLAGVTSWGIGCARAGNPGEWAKVSNFIEWINDNIGPLPPTSPPETTKTTTTSTTSTSTKTTTTEEKTSRPEIGKS